jgi:tRNA nucleotidyltransferase (CCA-adding enzyme)
MTCGINLSSLSFCRIPDVEFGTPQDDAERRDFTINSLFYNIHTNQIEDWTGRGWDDIQNGLIVTPLEPRTTFLDDPLRVLRAIRFSVRYGYTLTCRSTIQLEEVRIAFETKVSRERVGIELEGMLSGKKAHPGNAIHTMHELHLSSLVFRLPPQTTPVTDDEWRLGLDYVARMPELVAPLLQDDIAAATTITKPDLRLLPLLSYLLPMRNRTYMLHKKERPVIEHVIKESLKFKSKDAQAAVTTYEVLDRMLNLLEGQDYTNRLVIGLLLRHVKEMWVTALVLAAVLRNDDNTTTMTRYLDAYHHMKELDNCWNTKPLLDGKCLMQELGITKGPGVGEAMEAQVKWMLEHPDATRETYLEVLRQQRKRRQAGEVTSW